MRTAVVVKIYFNMKLPLYIDSRLKYYEKREISYLYADFEEINSSKRLQAMNFGKI